MLIGYALPLTIRLRPRTLDAFLLAFDGSLGFQPSFSLGRFLVYHPALWDLTTVVYYAMPLGAAFLYGAYRGGRDSQSLCWRCSSHWWRQACSNMSSFRRWDRGMRFAAYTHSECRIRG